MERKNLLEFAAAVFIAVVFISSYASFGGRDGSAGTRSTATTTAMGTEISGSAVANIVSYGKIVDVNVTCRNASAVTASVDGFLNSLISGGSVSGSNPVTDNERSVLLGNYTVREMYEALAAKLGENATCTEVFASQATIQLPSSISVIYEGSSLKIGVPQDLRNYTERLRISNATTGKVPVSVGMLVSNDGTISDRQNQISVILQNP